MASTNFALKISIIASIACSVFAIQCYHCDSVRESSCGDKFESQERTKVDCDRLQQQQPHQTQQFGPFYIANATGCVKKLFDYIPGHPRIVRTCFYGDTKRTAVGCQGDINLPSERALSCDVCTENYCNGSSLLSSTVLGVALLFVLVHLIG